MPKEAEMPRCFLALPSSQLSLEIKKAIKQGAQSAGYRVTSYNDNPIRPGNTIQELIASAIASSDCIIADITGGNSNVYFELGLAQAMGKGLARNDNRKLTICDNRILTTLEQSLKFRDDEGKSSHVFIITKAM